MLRTFTTAVVALMLVVAACGGGNGDSDTGPDLGSEEGGALPTDFSTSDLPDDYPSELIPPNIVGGAFTSLGGIETATFETSDSYEDAVAFYTAALGEPSFSGGDDDGRLTSWTSQEVWVITILDTNPTSIGAVRNPTE